jgi:hypothetical protein
MDIAKLKTSQLLKIAAAAVLGIFLLSFGYRIVAPAGTSFLRSPMISSIGNPRMGYDMAVSEQSAAYHGDPSMLSIRNIMPMPPEDGITTGNDAENYEVTDYSATIETRNLPETCAAISDLKSRDYVIFLSSNEYDSGCSYTFKTENMHANEVLALLEGLDPKDLSENTHTIKSLVEDFTSETDILRRKMASIDETLEGAIQAYDEISALATDTRDVETSAKIIDSKIRIIEQLSQERINVSERLDRLERAKAEQLDRLEYTNFYVQIYENKFVDKQDLKDSWKNAVKQFVRDVNTVLQDISIGLIALLFLAAQWSLYLFILLIIAKYGWQLAKYIWNK